MEDTLKCKNCDKPLKPNWVFCPYCRQPVKVEPKKCRKCGEELEDEMVICPVCGEPAAKKPVVKKKPAAKNPVVKKAADKRPEAESVEISDVPFRNMFDAYSHGKLPFNQGYIVSSFFSETSYYSIYEVVSYAGLKEIFLTETGLQFITGGKKLYILVEPDTYQVKFQEPVSRAEGEKIPKRFSELEIITAKNQTKIMIAKEPNESFGSFTILRPTGINFAVVFYQSPDMYKSLAEFFVETLNRQRRVPEHDAKVAALKIIEILKKHMSFKGEYK
ncbi:MAG: zinc ribbon domain-containing protein [Spirochaetes bacterium]|nr:zinc ribbon domain-containing protein [Spirochaetota bacterium]